MTVPSPADLTPLAPWAITYPSAGRELAGYLVRPDGPGPFPAIVVNHGSGGLGPRLQAAAEAFNRMGFVALVPVRRGYNQNPGPNWREHITAPQESPEYGRQMVEALRQENDDVLAAADWLAAQPGVDGERLGVTGVSFGGMMTMLAISRTNRFKAAVNFAGAAMNWDWNVPIRDMLLALVPQIETPLFLIQAVNDYSIQPTYGLGAELARLGKPHEARIYPPNGTTAQEGHGFFATGIDAWRDDVEGFFKRWL